MVVSIKKLGVRLAQLYNAHMIRILSLSLFGAHSWMCYAAAAGPSAHPPLTSLCVVLKLYYSTFGNTFMK